LLWKNNNYNKIKDYIIDEKQERIYVLYEEDEKSELLGYNFEGKVKEINKLPKSIDKFAVFNNKIFIYNNNSISLLSDGIINKLFDENNLKIVDFNVKNDDIYILLEDKLISGKIK